MQAPETIGCFTPMPVDVVAQNVVSYRLGVLIGGILRDRRWPRLLSHPPGAGASFYPSAK